VVVVAAGIGEHAALAFVEVIEGERVVVGLKTSQWCEIGRVAGDLGDANSSMRPKKG